MLIARYNIRWLLGLSYLNVSSLRMGTNEVTSHLRSDDAIQDFNDPEVATYMSRRDWFQYVTDCFPDEVKCSVAFMLSLPKHLPLTPMRHVETQSVIYGSAYGPFFLAAHQDNIDCEIVNSGWNGF